ncbi:acyltransferase family protein [Neptunomonas antarctica]|uniref:acyltransferase family protein n=1 Tax=Neptunomonas antarctica TaxID=619304 RepID=UPI0006C7986E|nr:acyltransferase [Neptunomonas antarctica]
MKIRLLEFDYLRALAIMLIVLGHSVYNSEKGFPILLENLIRGGTAVFVFISGFFLHAVFSKNFELQSFMLKKLKNVYVPFLVVSLLGLTFKVFGWGGIEGLPGDKIGLNIFHTIKHFYVLYPHWYIPFIMVVFVLSPLFLGFSRLPVWRQLLLLGLFMLLAVFLHRPHGNANVFQSLLYYTPFYMLGIMYSQYRSWFETRQRQILLTAVLLVAGTLVLQTYVWIWVGNYHKSFFGFHGIDLQFIQKIGLCFILLAICQMLASRSTPNLWLKEVGDLSFAIFFLHPLFTMAMGNIFPQLGWQKVPGGAWLSVMMTLMVFSIHFFGSFYTARLFRSLLPGRSRWLIGA